MVVKKYPNADLARFENMFLSLGFAISLSLVIVVFNWKTYDKPSVVNIATTETFEDVVDMPLTVQPPPPPPTREHPNIVEVSDEEEIIQELEINLDIEITEEMAIAPTVVADLIINEEVVEEKADEIFTVVEELPTFLGGGNGEFLKWVGERLTYPPKAADANVQGKVFIQFVIEKDGAITDVTVLKGIGFGADEEAVRIVESAPKWSPAKQRGRPVRLRMILPITFMLKN